MIACSLIFWIYQAWKIKELKLERAGKIEVQKGGGQKKKKRTPSILPAIADDNDLKQTPFEDGHSKPTNENQCLLGPLSFWELGKSSWICFFYTFKKVVESAKDSLKKAATFCKFHNFLVVMSTTTFLIICM